MVIRILKNKFNNQPPQSKFFSLSYLTILTVFKTMVRKKFTAYIYAK